MFEGSPTDRARTAMETARTERSKAFYDLFAWLRGASRG